MNATRTDRGSTAITTAYTEGPDLVMERIFDAPRELVWKVMTDPERITLWWGPHGYTTTVLEMDARTGGRWRVINHTTGGEDAPFPGEYLKVEPPERLGTARLPGVDPAQHEVGMQTATT